MRRSYIQWFPLSLSNLYTVNTGSIYVCQSGGYRLPFTSHYFFSNPEQLRVTPKNEWYQRYEWGEPEKREKVEFCFSPFRYAIAEEKAQKYRVRISKEIVERAMANPETLADERLGVYLEERKVFNSDLASLPLALLAVNILCGDGYGTHAVSMIFRNDGVLERIKIEEKYRGRTTLFQARNLKNEVLERDEQIKSQKEEEHNNRFRF